MAPFTLWALSVSQLTCSLSQCALSMRSIDTLARLSSSILLTLSLDLPAQLHVNALGSLSASTLLPLSSQHSLSLLGTLFTLIALRSRLAQCLLLTLSTPSQLSLDCQLLRLSCLLTYLVLHLSNHTVSQLSVLPLLTLALLALLALSTLSWCSHSAIGSLSALSWLSLGALSALDARSALCPLWALSRLALDYPRS